MKNGVLLYNSQTCIFSDFVVIEQPHLIEGEDS